MEPAARPRRPRPSERIPSARLLAVRKAAAAFDSPFALRSPRWEALLDRRDAARAALDTLRAELRDALHAAVPAAADSDERHRLLAWKRDVFNGRPLSPPADAAPPALAPTLARYRDLLSEEDDLLGRENPLVLEEIRAALGRLLGDTRFRLACRYSSPALWEAVERGSDAGGAALTEAGRGLYAYAARFVAKANPFHVFAEIAFPPSLGMEPGADHEVVIDAPRILELEREALERDPAGAGVRLAPRPSALREGRHHFWVPAPRGLRVASLPAGPALDALAAFFRRQALRTGNPTGTRADCEAFLRTRLGPAAGDPGPLLDALAARGLVEPYRVTDLATFTRDLRGASPALDARLERLGPLHLAQVDTAGLARAEAALPAEAAPSGAGYHVNSYARIPLSTHEKAAAELADDLRAVKPFFLAEPNFAANSAVARAFVLRWLADRGRESAPLLEMLADYVRDLDALIALHRPDEDGHGRAWRAALAEERGTLTPARLAELLPRPAPRSRSVCFNGPYDHAAGVFYVSNAWAGEGRFVSRYLPGRTPLHTTLRDGRGYLHAELAVPPRTNLEWVVRAHPVGCGFDARQAHAFRRWVEPSEIVVEAAGGAVAYRHAPSGSPLRIHYRGFLLAEFLPAECQLLLIGHADTFGNPFELPDAPGMEGVRHVPALHAGRVCLRRERWAVPASALAAPTPAGGGDWLRGAAELRDRVRAALGTGEELWYYRTSDRAGGGGKPRFLDLRNPLGVAAFRRDVAALPADGVVSLSPMRPGPGGLFRHAGAPYVTEMMVEA